jgi:SNF2 family DNA or RNA helicase
MLASGTGYPDPANEPGARPQKMKLRTPSCKVDQILADFAEGMFDGHQLGMMFESRECLYMVRNALVEHKIARPQDFAIIAGDVPQAQRVGFIQGFQAGQRRIAMFTYAAGGTGITLTAADIVLAVQRSWNPIYNGQGIKRFHRVGSERHETVTVLDYVTANTVEVKQLKRMNEDAALLEQIVQDKDRLREMFGG